MSNMIDISDVFEFANDQAMRVREASIVALNMRPLLVPGSPSGPKHIQETSVLIDDLYARASIFFSETLLKDDQWNPEMKKIAIATAVGDAVAVVRACCEPFPDFERLQGVYHGRLGRLQDFQEMGMEYADEAFSLTSRIIQSLYAAHHIKKYDFDFELEMQSMIALHIAQLVEDGHAPDRVVKAWDSNISRLEKTISQIPANQGAMVKAQLGFSSMKEFVEQFVRNVDVLERRILGTSSPQVTP